MKKLIIAIGILFLCYGLYKGGQYLFQIEELTEYGKGYVWGSVIQIIIGCFLIFLGVRRKN